jgi:peptidoglycan/LPS O-acetylase OafA/YrhL
VDRDTNPRFLLGKARRILLPFFIVSTLQYVVNTYTPNTNNQYDIANIWRIYLYPWAQFWYLQALFTIFIVVFFIEKSSLLKKLRYFIPITAIMISLVAILNRHHYSGTFSINGTLYIAPFFLLGMGINRFSKFFNDRIVVVISLLIIISGMALQQLYWYQVTDYNPGRRSLLILLMSCSAIIILFHFRRNVRFLSWLGFYSYAIYLFHVFGGAGSRILFTSLGLSSKPLLFISGMIFGLMIPILAEAIILRFAWLKFLLLGLRTKKKY